MSGLMKTMSISTQPSCHFSKKLHRLFHSINHRQSVTTQLTHPPCLCVAGWCALLTPQPAGHGGPRLFCEENDQFY